MSENQKQLPPFDPSVLKDLSDMVKARNIFFVPFFGVFLAFLVAQSKYIISTNGCAQILIASTFICGTIYAYVVSNYLWILETLRFMYHAQSAEGQPFTPPV
jgi:hypothetical protein